MLVSIIMLRIMVSKKKMFPTFKYCIDYAISKDVKLKDENNKQLWTFFFPYFICV
jgi:hypothetical protein